MMPIKQSDKNIKAKCTGKISNQKIDDSNKIYCNVMHIVSYPDRNKYSKMFIAKSVMVTIFFVCSIIGSIFAMKTSRDSKYQQLLHVGKSIDGEWSPWAVWSQCSVSCSSAAGQLGTMTRLRYCNSPAPQLSGKYCDGTNIETTECRMSQCTTADAVWTSWSSWSSCSEKCRTATQTPMQYRFRNCTNISGGCTGTAVVYRFCSDLPLCSAIGEWGEWYIAGPCESTGKQSCSLGMQQYRRQCKDNNCKTGSKEKTEDCWFNIGCPTGLQAPLNVDVFGNGTGIFNVTWSSVPYGETASFYRIYMTVENKIHAEFETLRYEVPVQPPTKVSGRNYWKTISLTQYFNVTEFDFAAVRISSVNHGGFESPLTEVVRSDSTAVDGKWGEWGYWSDCSTKCFNTPGSRHRIRECNNPTPSSTGKTCKGIREETSVCIGMEEEC